jgi:hypothetical protein
MSTPPVTELGTLLAHQTRGRRSPKSSISSSSSRSSAPYPLAAVTELDEENSELPWPAPNKRIVSNFSLDHQGHPEDTYCLAEVVKFHQQCLGVGL